MSRPVLLRLCLSVLTGVPAGFVALAFAAANEPNIPGPLLSVFSPGLKVAELLATPTVQAPLGSVFGQFLRVAFAVNAAYYVTIFAVAAQWLKQLRSRRDYAA